MKQAITINVDLLNIQTFHSPTSVVSHGVVIENPAKKGLSGGTLHLLNFIWLGQETRRTVRYNAHCFLQVMLPEELVLLHRGGDRQSQGGAEQ